MNLGDKIRSAREAADLSQEELANAVGVSTRTVGNWERGTVLPRSKTGALERVLAINLRIDSNDRRGVGLEEASDAQVLANIAQRLAEKDDRIRELLAERD